MFAKRAYSLFWRVLRSRTDEGRGGETDQWNDGEPLGLKPGLSESESLRRPLTAASCIAKKLPRESREGERDLSSQGVALGWCNERVDRLLVSAPRTN